MGAPHVFVDPADCEGHRVMLHGGVAHHVLRVRRRGVEGRTALRDVPLDLGVDHLTVAVGPEGGLTEDEVSQAGLPTVGLGGTVLRVETAALVAPALVMHRAGRLG